MDLYRTLATERPELAERVVFVTGDLVDPETARFLEATRARALFKPMNLEEVRRAVAETLGSPASRTPRERPTPPSTA